MNWLIIIPFAIAILFLLIFMIRRNMKDEKDFESQIKNDFHKAKHQEGDIRIEEETK